MTDVPRSQWLTMREKQPPVAMHKRSKRTPIFSDINLIKKYSVLPGPDLFKNQESEKIQWRSSKQKEQDRETRFNLTPSSGSNQGTKRGESESAARGHHRNQIINQGQGWGGVYEDTETTAHIPKVSTTTWFKPIPKSERPATPEPEWTIPPNDFPEPEYNWANAHATSYKVPEENKLQRKDVRYVNLSNGSADEQERRNSAKLI
ncbi:hypothetical protein Tco_0238261 [Tanacetum coccineum]